MRRPPICVALALSACALPRPSNEEVDPPPLAEQAKEELSGIYERQLGMSMDWGDVGVAWMAGECLEFVDVYHDEECLKGLTIVTTWPVRDSVTNVYLLYRDRVSDSSLLHEGLHALLWLETGDHDVYHEGPEWESEAEMHEEFRAWELAAEYLPTEGKDQDAEPDPQEERL